MIMEEKHVPTSQHTRNYTFSSSMITCRGSFIRSAAVKKREESHSPSYSDDSDYSDDHEDEEDYRRGGYHPVKIGEKFKDARYTVLHKLGWGHFSTVWMVADAITGGRGALKVVKSASHYTEAARDEVQLLSRAKECDPNDERHCCRLLDSFEHSGPHGRHICMVFEVLGDNLLALIRHYNHRGIPLPVVRHLTHQLLVALDFLHSTCGIIHTDLKPENVMLKEPLKPRTPLTIVGGADAIKSRPVGKIAAALAAGQPLTKNQKKKLRKKLNKEGPADFEALDGDDNQESKATQGEPVSSGDANAGVDGAASGFVANGSGSGVDTQPHEEAETSDGGDCGQRSEDGGVVGRSAETPCSLESRLMSMPCKIVDFGNACWVNKHFTDDIQTRQYRSPEVRNLIQ
jgi:serine/threonine-protein kinase SRPK3